MTHHYFDLDAVVIFDICNDEMVELLATMDRMIEEVKST